MALVLIKMQSRRSGVKYLIYDMIFAMKLIRYACPRLVSGARSINKLEMRYVLLLLYQFN